MDDGFVAAQSGLVQKENNSNHILEQGGGVISQKNGEFLGRGGNDWLLAVLVPSLALLPMLQDVHVLHFLHYVSPETSYNTYNTNNRSILRFMAYYRACYNCPGSRI